MADGRPFTAQRRHPAPLTCRVPAADSAPAATVTRRLDAGRNGAPDPSAAPKPRKPPSPPPSRTSAGLYDEPKAAETARAQVGAILHRARTAARAIDATATALASERARLDAELTADQAQRLRRPAGRPELHTAAPEDSGQPTHVIDPRQAADP